MRIILRFAQRLPVYRISEWLSGMAGSRGATHSNGDLVPTEFDLVVNTALRQARALLGIRLLDHLVTA